MPRVGDTRTGNEVDSNHFTPASCGNNMAPFDISVTIITLEGIGVLFSEYGPELCHDSCHAQSRLSRYGHFYRDYRDYRDSIVIGRFRGKPRPHPSQTPNVTIETATRVRARRARRR